MSDKQVRTKYTREFKLEVVRVRRLRQWQWQWQLRLKPDGSVRISVCEAVSEIVCCVNSIFLIQAPARPPEAPPVEAGTQGSTPVILCPHGWAV